MVGDNKKKGFAGLDSMVSDIEESKPKPPSAPEPPVQRPAVPSSPAERPEEPSKPPKAQPQPAAYAGNSPSGGGGIKWGWIVTILIILLVVFSNSGNKQPSPQSARAPTPAPTNVPNQNPTPPSTVAASASNRPNEAVPPIGVNLTLNREQIWYCLSEDIRLGGMRDVLHNESELEVSKFNGAIDDFNSRCSRFRYRVGALETAREGVELYRLLLRTEGAQRVASWRQIATPLPETPSIQQERSVVEMPRSVAPKSERRQLTSDRTNPRQHETRSVKSKAETPSVQTSLPSYRNAFGAVQTLDKNGVAHFLDNGYGINQTLNGNTLLVVAVRMGDYEIVEYIINRGADINLKDGSGDSPMLAAKKASNPNARIIKLLKDHGAINVCKRIIYTNPTWTTDCGIETGQ